MDALAPVLVLAGVKLEVVEGTGRRAAARAPLALFNTRRIVHIALAIDPRAGVQIDVGRLAGLTVRSVSHALVSRKTDAYKSEWYARAGATEATATVRATAVEKRMVILFAGGVRLSGRENR